MLTTEQFRSALPAQIKQTVSQDLIDSVNKSLADPEAMEIYKENLLSYTSVLKDGKFRLSGYVNAVRYVSFKVMGTTNLDAYVKTFPVKYQDFLSRNVSDKDIASYVSAYNKSKLVNLIFEQTLIPTHILNAPLFQRALNVQADLMLNARSEMVRMQAANSILTQLKPPETKKFELDIGVKEDSSIKTLKDTMLELVIQQKALLSAGATALDIAQSSLIIDTVLEEVHA